MAINNRGDMLASGGGGWILWPGNGSAPITHTNPQYGATRPIDLDEDGTVLMAVRRISNGKVLGQNPSGDFNSWVWDTHSGQVTPLTPRGSVDLINQQGLLAGRNAESGFRPALWQGTTLLTNLPDAPGGTPWTVQVLGDDNTIAGASGPDRKYRWSCR
ncbi:hypothetical protein HNR67_005869 [Crossiella cryophila]|uniref:Uncharacterized protein n=1 Tax=Crossiella cryophila TaxID=43355 RepID=A0A7W7CEN2_9PSEU|nr:hypothetical protein [Crossiella cryophila]